VSAEAINKIIKEVKALTPEERRQLLARLTREEKTPEERLPRKAGTLKGTVKYIDSDFDAPLDDFKEFME
jgi:hypothetical protein